MGGRPPVRRGYSWSLRPSVCRGHRTPWLRSSALRRGSPGGADRGHRSAANGSTTDEWVTRGGLPKTEVTSAPASRCPYRSGCPRSAIARRRPPHRRDRHSSTGSPGLRRLLTTGSTGRNQEHGGDGGVALAWRGDARNVAADRGGGSGTLALSDFRCCSRPTGPRPDRGATEVGRGPGPVRAQPLDGGGPAGGGRSGPSRRSDLAARNAAQSHSTCTTMIPSKRNLHEPSFERAAAPPAE